MFCFGLLGNCVVIAGEELRTARLGSALLQNVWKSGETAFVSPHFIILTL